MNKIIKILNLSAVVITSLLLFSCASSANYDFSKIDATIEKGDFSEAYAKIEAENQKIYSKHDEVLKDLDQGLLSHYAEQYETSN